MQSRDLVPATQIPTDAPHLSAGRWVLRQDACRKRRPCLAQRVANKVTQERCRAGIGSSTAPGASLARLRAACSSVKSDCPTMGPSAEQASTDAPCGRPQAPDLSTLWIAPDDRTSAAATPPPPKASATCAHPWTGSSILKSDRGLPHASSEPAPHQSLSRKGPSACDGGRRNIAGGGTQLANLPIESVFNRLTSAADTSAHNCSPVRRSNTAPKHGTCNGRRATPSLCTGRRNSR
jgi:hypothetical protein